MSSKLSPFVREVIEGEVVLGRSVLSGGFDRNARPTSPGIHHLEDHAQQQQRDQQSRPDPEGEGEYTETIGAGEREGHRRFLCVSIFISKVSNQNQLLITTYVIRFQVATKN